MADLIIYDSSRAESIHTARLALMDYPAATIKDTKGLVLSDLNTWIGTLSAEAYDKIISCVNDTRVEEVCSTAVLTITEGAANEVGFVTVDLGGGTVIPLAVVTADASGNYHDAIALTDSINDGTDYHGFSASRTDDAITITAPAGSGAGGDSYSIAVDVTNGGTLDIVITKNFGADVNGVTAVGETGDFSEAYFIDLEAKVSAAPEDTGTAQAGANGSVTLAADASATDDYYKDMFVIITANTGADQVRRITAYDGTTKVATVDYNWGTNPDATSTYLVSSDLLSYGRAVGGINPPLLFWQDNYPNNMEPLLPKYVGGETLYEKNDKTATGVTSSTLSDTGEFVSGAYDDGDYYVAIKSATLGAGQIRLIASNTANALTLDKDWDVTPTGTVVYQIARKHILYDLYIPAIMLTYFNDLEDDQQHSVFSKMIDRYDDRTLKREIYQDLSTIDEYMEKASNIIIGVGAGVTI